MRRAAAGVCLIAALMAGEAAAQLPLLAVPGVVDSNALQGAGAADQGMTPQAPAREQIPRGNPLWAIPLKALTATRERPIFLPSRRAPAPAVAGPVRVEPAAPPPQPSGPERPQLALVGAIIGESEGIAVFIDQTSNGVVRLRTGESHAGWTLRSVKGREAKLEKNNETVILALPAPGEAPATGQAGVPLPPGQKEPDL